MSFIGKINSGRITSDVKIGRVSFRWKGVILNHRFIFGFPHTLIMNDSASWIHNTNSVNNLILFQNTCGVWNGRTQGIIIGRINGMRGQRLREQIHVITSRLASQICVDIKSRWGGRM